jgi:hypothetical protein
MWKMDLFSGRAHNSAYSGTRRLLLMNVWHCLVAILSVGVRIRQYKFLPDGCERVYASVKRERGRKKQTVPMKV